MSTDRTRGYRAIADYAMIGDPHTVALVASDGSIDWCCWPRFDSPAVFCRLLDAGKGGYFQVRPADRFASSRSYVGPTNVLATTFETADGRVRLTDFMPAWSHQAAGNGDGHHHSILRLIEGLAGDVEMEVGFHPTFGFAGESTAVTAGEGGAVARGDHNSAVLSCPIPLAANATGGLRGRARVSSGDRIWLALSFQAEGDPASNAIEPASASAEMAATLAHWEAWSGKCTYAGPYRDLVLRSALALKLLTFEPTGAVIAAPTTSLPEQIGGIRNWDYRYTWLRDSALILEALQAIGYHDEADGFFRWLESVWTRHHGSLQIMYNIDGDPRLPEGILSHLEGYRRSSPVRIGNGACKQIQLDVYGEVLDAAYFCQVGQRSLDPHLWAVLSGLADQAAARWRDPDRGIWEVRGGPRQFLYSKLLCWVAVDRAIKLSKTCGPPTDTRSWKRAREDIREAILARGYNEEIGAFGQSLDDPVLDASALAIPTVGFLPATDPRVQSTIEKIREQLTSNGLVYRYTFDDGLPRGEATFALCSFWLVDALALSGRVDEARSLFEQIVGHANDVGLLAEEIDPVTKELLGNFPQGFSHLALIRSALHIAKAEKFGPEHQAKTRADRAGELAHAGRQPSRL